MEFYQLGGEGGATLLGFRIPGSLQDALHTANVLPWPAQVSRTGDLSCNAAALVCRKRVVSEASNVREVSIPLLAHSSLRLDLNCTVLYSTSVGHCDGRKSERQRPLLTSQRLQKRDKSPHRTHLSPSPQAIRHARPQWTRTPQHLKASRPLTTHPTDLKFPTLPTKPRRSPQTNP